MAVNPIQFLVSASATATNGSKTITLTGSVDASFVSSGTAVFVEGRHVVEAVSGTGVTPGDGTSTITLRDNWTQPTTTAKLTAFNTLEGLAEAIRSAREIVANVQAIGDLTGTGLIEKTGSDPDTYAVVTITAAGKALLDDASASAQRTTLGLGTAATANVTTSATDTTAGRLLKVGDFGVGSFDPPNVTTNQDIKDKPCGFYDAAGITLDNGITFFGAALKLGRGAQGIGTILYSDAGGNIGDNSLKLYAQTTSGNTNDWGDIEELYHTGNLNVNEFEVENGRVLGSIGIPPSLSTTLVDFNLPINSYSSPTSLSVNGSFNIISNVDNTVVASSVTPVLAPISTERNAIARFTVTGANPSHSYRAVATTSAKITVNF